MADDASNAESIRNRMEIRGGEWISLELSNIRFLRSSMAGGYYDKPELREWISANGKFNSAHNSIKRLYRPREDDDYLIEDEARPLGKEQCLSAWGGYACEVKIKPVESFEELSFAPPWEVSLQEDFPEYPVAEQHELEKTAYEWRWDTVEFPPVKRGICSSSVEVSDDQDFDLESETKYRPEFLITLFVSENHFAILEKSLLNAETEIQVRATFGPCYVDGSSIILTSSAVLLTGVEISTSTPIEPHEGDKQSLAELESLWMLEVHSLKHTFWQGIYLLLACMLLGMWIL